MVFTSNIVRMAFYLVLSLGATAGLFFLAGADFVGAMQLLIYVGGTLVLLIFGVMLTAQGPFISMKTSGGEWILAAFVGGSLLAVLLPAAFKIGDWQNEAQSRDPTPPRATSAQRPTRLPPHRQAPRASAWGCSARASISSTSRTPLGGPIWPAICCRLK